MPYYLFSIKTNKAGQTFDGIKSIMGNCDTDGKRLKINKGDFRFGNLDSLFYFNDRVTKHEGSIESIIKKVTKTYLDFPESKKDFIIETRE